MSILITLCARGGSKGIPGKNIRLLNNVPLIAYSINCAVQFRELVDEPVDIFLSSDSLDIINVARQFGVASDYIRPDYLASDTAGKLDAIIHVREFAEKTKQVEYDTILDLDISSPLRTSDDLLNAYKMLYSDPIALNIFSVNKANRNPYFNMVEKGENGYYELSKKLDKNVLSRQQAPQVYELNASFYFYKRSFFNQEKPSVISGKALIYEMPHICFDLDHESDFDFMEFLLSTNRLNFQI